jgi:hypothetical protein
MSEPSAGGAEGCGHRLLLRFQRSERLALRDPLASSKRSGDRRKTVTSPNSRGRHPKPPEIVEAPAVQVSKDGITLREAWGTFSRKIRDLKY